MPNLSICIPTYNRLQYLQELLPQVLDQANGVSEGEVEVVVSDNGSTDGTGSYLASLNQPKLRFWTNEANIGGDRNFLKCIREARGEYVWLLGDDDLVPAGAVARVVGLIGMRRPDLLVSGPAGAELVEYGDYREFLEKRCARSAREALGHTLISANVFRHEVFDGAFAEKMLYTQYAHMLGLMKNLTGKVVVSDSFVGVRPVRAEFAKYPSCLCVKQALYFWFLAKRFGLPRFRWYAFLNACNLPLEVASRIKHFAMLFAGRRQQPVEEPEGFVVNH